LDGAVPAAGPRRPIPVPSTPAQLDLPAHDIQTVIWATGYRRSYPWLKVPVLDAHGDFRHRAGVTPAPGLYAIGLFFQTRRNSSLIDGVGLDARHLAEHVEAHLSRRVVSAA
jgi:putative flavoprotein involved in K+ transport